MATNLATGGQHQQDEVAEPSQAQAKPKPGLATAQKWKRIHRDRIENEIKVGNRMATEGNTKKWNMKLDAQTHHQQSILSWLKPNCSTEENDLEEK